MYALVITVIQKTVIILNNQTWKQLKALGHASGTKSRKMRNFMLYTNNLLQFHWIPTLMSLILHSSGLSSPFQAQVVIASVLQINLKIIVSYIFKCHSKWGTIHYPKLRLATLLCHSKLVGLCKCYWSQRKPNWVSVCPYFYLGFVLSPNIAVGLSSRPSPSLFLFIPQTRY